ncbi:MAG: DUF5658 family protein [Deltaproteobacteria bacterium]|jgi:hypothetical protein|nr:DUF5658 family protein [Deltaproteobacteria bacterium]
MDENKFIERRSGRDRRARQTSPFSIQSLFGSRRYYRRKEDAERYFFVDLYSPSSAAVLLITLVLSIVDAFLTLKLVGCRIKELNPVMCFFLKLGPVAFIMAKWFFTAFGLLTLLIFKNYYLWKGKVRTAALLGIVPILYLAIISYEVYLLVNT